MYGGVVFWLCGFVERLGFLCGEVFGNEDCWFVFFWYLGKGWWDYWCWCLWYIYKVVLVGGGCIWNSIDINWFDMIGVGLWLVGGYYRRFGCVCFVGLDYCCDGYVFFRRCYFYCFLF